MATTTYYEGDLSILVDGEIAGTVHVRFMEYGHGLLIRITEEDSDGTTEEKLLYAPPEQAKDIGHRICDAVGAYKDCREKNR